MADSVLPGRGTYVYEDPEPFFRQQIRNLGYASGTGNNRWINYLAQQMLPGSQMMYAMNNPNTASSAGLEGYLGDLAKGATGAGGQGASQFTYQNFLGGLKTLFSPNFNPNELVGLQGLIGSDVDVYDQGRNIIGYLQALAAPEMVGPARDLMLRQMKDSYNTFYAANPQGGGASFLDYLRNNAPSMLRGLLKQQG